MKVFPILIISLYSFLSNAQLSDTQLIEMGENDFFFEMIKDESFVWVRFNHTNNEWHIQTENDAKVGSFYFNEENSSWCGKNLKTEIRNKIKYLLKEGKNKTTEFIVSKKDSDWCVYVYNEAKKNSLK